MAASAEESRTAEGLLRQRSPRTTAGERSGDSVSEEQNKQEAVSEENRNVGESSLRAAGLNMMTQVTFRLITFAMNAFVLRHISRDVLGLINVRLNLLDDTILFLSREGFRLAALSHNSGRVGWQKMINLVWLAVPTAILWAWLLGWVWLALLPAPTELLQEQYSAAVWLVAVSGVMQMFAEPPFVAAQLLMFVRVRVSLDAVWVLTRVLVLCLAVSLVPHRVVEVWAWGHFLAGVFYVLGHYLAFHFILKHPSKQLPLSSLGDFLPNLRNWEVNPAQWKVASSFLGQGVMKQLLTEGEKYVMTVFSLLSLSEQGLYDVITNLGSLAARFVFRPVEESAYFFFSQLWRRAVPLEQQQEAEKVSVGLHRLLRLMLLLGLLVLGVGYSYCHLLLHLYGGPLLTDGAGPDLLRAQCLLIFFLAINGVTECFARSAMTDSEINSHTRTMTVMSVLYLGLAWLFTTYLGPVGFTVANCANMAVRIALSVRIIRNVFREQQPPVSESHDVPRPLADPLDGLRPDTDLLLVLGSGFVCCQVSEVWLYPWSPLAHLSVGLVIGVLLLLCIIVKEDFILEFLALKLRGSEAVNDQEEEEEEEEGDLEKRKTK